MVLEWLRLHDFRNISQALLRFDPGLNLITGANGQGKSNLLEAVGLMATGRSFRRVPPGVMRRFNQLQFRVSGAIHSRGIRHQLEILGEANRQTVRLNGKPMASVSVMDRVLTAVIVTPETPILVRGGPGERRNFLDWVIFSTIVRHGLESKEYHRALKARNQLLRNPRQDVREIDAWETHLAILGARIALRRYATVKRLMNVLPIFLEALDLESNCYDLILISQLETILTNEKQQTETLTAFLKNLLQNSRQKDQRTGITSVGPHRDDLLFRLNGQPLARFGSRGQQKRFAFALKLAEAALLEEALGEPPVMVLDDPVSELDQDGIRRLMELLAHQGRQLFVTVRDAGDIPWSNRSLMQYTVVAGDFQITTEHVNL